MMSISPSLQNLSEFIKQETQVSTNPHCTFAEMILKLTKANTIQKRTPNSPSLLLQGINAEPVLKLWSIHHCSRVATRGAPMIGSAIGFIFRLALFFAWLQWAKMTLAVLELRVYGGIRSTPCQAFY